MQEIEENNILPQPNESVAIALGREKIAALCYDRVWSPSAQWRSPRTEVPDSIRFFCGTAPERALIKNLYIRESSSHDISLLLEQSPLAYSKIVLLLLKWRVELDRKTIPELNVDQIKQKVLNELSDEDSAKISSYSYDFIKSLAYKLLHTPMMQQINEDSLLKLINEKKFEDALKYAHGISCVQREITKLLAEIFGIHTVNIYDSENARMKEFTEGDRRVVVASLEGLGIIDNSELTWEQILEFREDSNARYKYIRFLHWLDKDMIGKSPSFIQDEISIRLDDYEKSLKKHGIKTIVGTVSEVLDGKYILGSSGITAGLSLSGHPVLGFLLGAGLLIGKVAVKLSETALSFDDIELGNNSEISWVYEVKQLPKRHL